MSSRLTRAVERTDTATSESSAGGRIDLPGVARSAVTGATGFVGGALARRLVEQGVEVVALVRGAAPDLERLGVKLIYGELTDASAVGATVEGCDVVFHLAARAGLGGRRHEFEAVNVGGTANVVAASRRRGVPRLVHTSTPSVVDMRRPLRGADESTPLAGHRSHYSRTKAQAERLALAGNGGDLAVVAIRPHAVWGPGDSQLLPRLVDRARRGHLRRIGRADPLIDLTFIDNAVDAHLLAARALVREPDRVSGRAYFVSDCEPVRLWGLVERVLTFTGGTIAPRPVPLAAAQLAAYATEAAWRLLRPDVEPPISRYLVDLLSRDHWFDIAAARRDLAYSPRIGLDEGIERLARTWTTE